MDAPRLNERSSPHVVNPTYSSQDEAAPVQRNAPFLRLPGELRNRIYEIIIEQCPSKRNRVNLGRERKVTKMKKRLASTRPTHSRPYMGLAQTCRLLREEFRPLYLGSMRFSTRFNALPYALDLFGSPDMKRDLGSIMKDLAQTPLPATGVDLFELTEKMRIHQDKWRVLSGGDQRWPTCALVGHSSTIGSTYVMVLLQTSSE
ncbi:hypothetical protein IQ06DRAFT_16629 [Phaeosphaeriaceae sp. SRC1lsM3a]|nr:hypothetical protein IQ06DRAFT_16629 [Stagonospora sp. SRC1lsM3a]